MLESWVTEGRRGDTEIHREKVQRVTKKKAPVPGAPCGAGDGIRTHDNLLGKQVRYRCVTPANPEPL